MANVTTSAESNLINSAAMKKAREIDFVKMFGNNGIKTLMEALGTSRVVEKKEGEDLYVYDFTPDMASGSVGEGEVIPLSKITQTKTKVGTIVFDKRRKATSLEAISKSGWDVAVTGTDQKALSEVQKGIRTRYFTTIGTLNSTTSTSASTLQALLANIWGQLQVKFEDDAVQPVYFLNPLDFASYLGTASITLQTAFGMSYLENFLGLGRVIMTPQVPQGKVYATAQGNIIVYKLTMTGDIARAFGLTVDETGLIGINSGGFPNQERGQVESLIVSGIDILPEYAAGVVIGTLNP